MNPNLHGFQATGAMGGERASHTATLLPNGKVLVAGGTDSLGNDLATAELFDPSTGTFTATGSMIHPAYLLRAPCWLTGRPPPTAKC